MTPRQRLTESLREIQRDLTVARLAVIRLNAADKAVRTCIQEAEDLSVAGTLAEAEAKYDDLLRRLEDNPTTNQPAAPPVHAEQPALSRKERHAAAIKLINEWLADDSDYDEDTWNRLREALTVPHAEPPVVVPNMGPNVQAAVDLLNSQREAVAVPDVDLSNSQEAPEQSAPVATEKENWRPYLAERKAIDNLVKEHERVKAALRGLGTAIGDVVRYSPGGAAHPSRSTIEELREREFAAWSALPSNAQLREWAAKGENRPPDSFWRATDDPFKPVPEAAAPIEVEMLLTSPPWANAGWTWTAHLGGLDLDGSQGWPSEYFESAQDATENADTWLAALSEKLGVSLVATWPDSV